MKQLRTWRRSLDTIEPWGLFSPCAVSDMLQTLFHIYYTVGNKNTSNIILIQLNILSQWMRHYIVREYNRKILHKDPCLRVKIKPLSTYLHIIWRGLIACSLEGLRHIAKDLHRRQQVTSVKVPPLGEVKQVFRDLGHPIPCQHPLTLSKVPLNLQKEEKTELGASLWYIQNKATHFGVNGVQKSGRETQLSEALCVTLISKSGRNVFCLTDVLKSANMNKRVNWSRRHIFRQKLHRVMSLNARSQVQHCMHDLSSSELFYF